MSGYDEKGRGSQRGSRRGSGHGGRKRHQHDGGKNAWSFNMYQGAQEACTEESVAVDAYCEKWRPLIKLELDEQKSQVEARLRSWPMERLLREGVVLLGLRGSTRGSYFGKTILRFAHPNGDELPFHRFGSGDIVLITKNNPLQERPVEGLMLDKTRNEVRVVVDRLPQGLYDNSWRALTLLSIVDVTSAKRLDQGTNTVMFERMETALKAMYKSPWRPYTADDEDDLPPGCGIRDALLAPSPEAVSSPSSIMPDAAVTWARAQLAAERVHPASHCAELGLNKSQVDAVATAILNKVSLLQGPPGTGKTTTIVRFLALLKRHFRLGLPVLAVAQSNVAVDNLLEGLLDAGVGALRVGQPLKVRTALRNATLDAKIEAHPASAAIEEERQKLSRMRRELPSLRGRDRGLGHRDVNVLRNGIRKQQQEMMSDLLKGADVICATCVGAGSDTLSDLSFPLVILDEGSQCSEPESLIPLVKGAQHVVLVGDHFQLPPTCVSQDAAQRGLALSLFERLIRANLPSTMLQVQYRMHPSLSHFPNHHFYGGRLLDGVTEEQRTRPQLALPSTAHSVVFVDVAGQEVASQGGSKLNWHEAALVLEIVRDLLAKGEDRTALGVVTPYLAQMHALSDTLRALPFGPLGSGELEVKSVDGYQGREKDIIVFSCVRANPQTQVGFLDDWRRMNVAITRARRGLIIVGNAATLSGDPHWGAYLSWLRRQGCVVAEAAMRSRLA